MALRRLSPEGALADNWLDWIRLAMALLVLFSHCFPLTHTAPTYDTEPLFRLSRGQEPLGMVAVAVFFTISGFLILRSWLRVGSMGEYFRHRVLRIHPGFIVATIASLLAALPTVASIPKFLGSFSIVDFLLSFIDLQHGILDAGKLAYPGNISHAVNAPLWTISLEFEVYIGLAIYGLFGLYKYRGLWLVFAGAVLALTLRQYFLGEPAHRWWAYDCYFVMGMTCYLFRDRIPRSPWLFGLCLALLAASVRFDPWFRVALQILLPYLVFYIAFLPTKKWTPWTHRTDLSYGVYLYAWIAQQSLVFWLHIRNPWVLFLAAAPLTLLVAAMSWRWIEKPCLGWKKRPFADRDAAADAPR